MTSNGPLSVPILHCIQGQVDDAVGEVGQGQVENEYRRRMDPVLKPEPVKKGNISLSYS